MAQMLDVTDLRWVVGWRLVSKQFCLVFGCATLSSVLGSDSMAAPKICGQELEVDSRMPERGNRYCPPALLSAESLTRMN